MTWFLTVPMPVATDVSVNTLELLTGIGTVATGVGALVAVGVSLYLWWVDRRDRREAANTEVAAEAAGLLRELRSWDTGSWSEDWSKRHQKVVQLVASQGYKDADERALKLARRSSRAHKEIRLLAWDAYKLFYSATEKFNRLADLTGEERSPGQKAVRVNQDTDHAGKELENCTSKLQTILKEVVHSKIGMVVREGT